MGLALDAGHETAILDNYINAGISGEDWSVDDMKRMWKENQENSYQFSQWI